MSERPARTAPEWVTLIASIVVVLAVVALIAIQTRDGEDPAAPTVEVRGVRQVGSEFHVDVEVRNEGDQTAASVQVSAELTIGDRSFTGDQHIDFLSGGDDAGLSFVFSEDPAAGELVVAVASYAEP